MPEVMTEAVEPEKIAYKRGSVYVYLTGLNASLLSGFTVKRKQQSVFGGSGIKKATSSPLKTSLHPCKGKTNCHKEL